MYYILVIGEAESFYRLSSGIGTRLPFAKCKDFRNLTQDQLFGIALAFFSIQSIERERTGQSETLPLLSDRPFHSVSQEKQNRLAQPKERKLLEKLA